MVTESARDSLWTKTFHLDNICLEARDLHLELLSPFRSAPLKSVLDFHKEQMKAQQNELKTEGIYKCEKGARIPQKRCYTKHKVMVLRRG